MFVDEVRIIVKGGKGGNGRVSFRREKFVPFGGPDGGNGGEGGDVVLLSENNLDTLSDFRGKKVFKALEGVSGGGQKLAGKNAEKLILKVPTGTVVQDVSTKEILYDFTKPHEEFVVARGGRGGFGNAHFTSSTRQAPKFAELGDEGEEKTVLLTLKLIADVGIIGLPNAGKSTLISRISAAKPAIADYPFTTLTPKLGIVDHKGKSFVVADTPGLIENASKGKGLGIQFLKHIERTRVLLHLIDGSQEEPYKAYSTIFKELKKFKKELGEKPQIVVINKTDVLDDTMKKAIEKIFTKKKIAPVLFISSASGRGLGELLDEIIRILNTIPKEKPAPEKTSFRVYRPHLDDPHFFSVTKKKGRLVVTGQRIEQIVRMSPMGNTEAMERIYDVLHKMGIYKELVKQGAKDGGKVSIAKREIVFRE